MLRAYPKVQGLGPRVVVDPLLAYYIEEKVDGSQFSFGVRDGELHARSKNTAIAIDAPPAMFLGAVQTAFLLADAGLLNEGWTYRAEALAKPKHNALAYDRHPVGNLVLFDVETEDGTPLGWREKGVEAERLGVEVVPVKYVGRGVNYPLLVELLADKSYLGGPLIEGVVIKPVVPQYVVFGGQEIRLVMKHVSEAFKEVNAKNWKNENPGKRDAIALVTSALRTEARWAKAAQHLRDDGRLTGTVRDIGPLVQEVQRDIFEDDAGEVGALLLQHFLPILKKTSAAGVAEWYKSRLLLEALGEEA